MGEKLRGRIRRRRSRRLEVSITKRINSSDSCYEWSPPNFFLIIHLEARRRRRPKAEGRRGKGREPARNQTKTKPPGRRKVTTQTG